MIYGAVAAAGAAECLYVRTAPIRRAPADLAGARIRAPAAPLAPRHGAAGVGEPLLLRADGDAVRAHGGVLRRPRPPAARGSEAVSLVLLLALISAFVRAAGRPHRRAADQ